MIDHKLLLLYRILAAATISYIRKTVFDQKLNSIPIVGPSGFAGYDQYPDGVFRVARLFRWDFVVCGPKYVNEIGSAPENVLSFYGGVEERIHIIKLQYAPVSLGTFTDVSLMSETKLIFGPLISYRKQSTRQAMKHLGTLVEERLAKENELGPDWAGKPNDLISWLLEIAEGEERTAPALVTRVLVTNMAAIHTSSMLLSAAFKILPIREEVERVIKEEGWTKATLNNMVKVDSFLRESQCMNGNGPLSMTLKALLSLMAVIPYGSFVSVAARPVHYDPSNYDNPAHFDGFRFAKMREAQNKNRRKISSGATWSLRGLITWFSDMESMLARDELKAMMAHLVLNYDVKAEVEGVRPPNEEFGMMFTPNRTGRGENGLQGLA
ncbi:cytochrome P450 [Mycena sp. CBHHK59/15]|nr:cytochrome P450 [Mycena sp. CBHHK59/15]